MMRMVAVLTGVASLALGAVVYFQLATSDTTGLTGHPTLPVTPPPAVPVEVAAATAETVPIFLAAIGTVQASNTVNVKTQVDGQITDVLFHEGQDVRTGDALMVIDPRPYQALVRQRLAARQRDLALLHAAELDLARYQKLIRQSFAAQQQVDQQLAQVGQYQAAVADDDAQIDFAQTQLGFTTITAPIDGRVGIRQVDTGNFVRAGDSTTLVVITLLRPIAAIFTISADALARSNLGLGATHVPVIALGQDDTTELGRGTVDMVDNQVDPSTGTIKLKASFPNADLRLWPGNFINGRLIVDTRRDAVTVPSAAIRHGPSCDFAWIVRPDATASTQCVVPGQVFAGRTLIDRGITAGQSVVVDGQYRLDEGSRVAIGSTPPR